MEPATLAIWHVRGRDRDLVVDTGVGVASVVEGFVALLDRPVVCVASHIHYDHVGCLHEFDHRLMHPEAAPLMNPYRSQMPLRWSAFDDEAVAAARSIGYVIDRDEMIDALPRPGFDIDAFHTEGVTPTATIDEGDIIDLGDRHLEVLHLPGHTPGSIGLWEQSTKVLFAGDAVYDGPLIDFLPESDIDALHPHHATTAPPARRDRARRPRPHLRARTSRRTGRRLPRTTHLEARTATRPVTPVTEVPLHG